MFEHVTDMELRSALNRFLNKVEDHSSDEKCWIWKGARSWTYYGMLRYKSKNWQAHRFSYWLQYGKLTPGLQIDHLCKVRLCVNPLHLEEVEQITNLARGINTNRDKIHCKHGHTFDESNTGHGHGAIGPQRWCRACHRDRKRLLHGG